MGNTESQQTGQQPENLKRQYTNRTTNIEPRYDQFRGGKGCSDDYCPINYTDPSYSTQLKSIQDVENTEIEFSNQLYYKGGDLSASSDSSFDSVTAPEVSQPRRNNFAKSEHSERSFSSKDNLSTEDRNIVSRTIQKMTGGEGGEGRDGYNSSSERSASDRFSSATPPSNRYDNKRSDNRGNYNYGNTNYGNTNYGNTNYDKTLSPVRATNYGGPEQYQTRTSLVQNEPRHNRFDDLSIPTRSDGVNSYNPKHLDNQFTETLPDLRYDDNYQQDYYMSAEPRSPTFNRSQYSPKKDQFFSTEDYLRPNRDLDTVVSPISEKTHPYNLYGSQQQRDYNSDYNFRTGNEENRYNDNTRMYPTQSYNETGPYDEHRGSIQPESHNTYDGGGLYINSENGDNNVIMSQTSVSSDCSDDVSYTA
jgi:hypothetical protein